MQAGSTPEPSTYRAVNVHLGERACWSEPPHLSRAIARIDAAAQPNTGGQTCKQNTRKLQADFDTKLCASVAG